MSTNWTDNIPASGEKISTSRPEIEMNLMLLKAALGMNHLFPGNDGVDAGEHVQAVFTAPLAAKPTLTGTKGGLYTKTVDGHTELFYEKEDGTEIQLTPILSSLAELNTLHSSGITNADLIKLHAITATALELSTLYLSGITNDDLVYLHARSSPVALTVYEVLHLGHQSNYTSISLVAAEVPTTAHYVWGYVDIPGATPCYLSPTNTGTGKVLFKANTSIIPFYMPILTAQTLWYKTDGGDLSVYISGYGV